MTRLGTLLVSLLLTFGAGKEIQGKPKVWSIWLKLNTCGCKLAYVEAHPPGEEKAIYSTSDFYIVQWTYTPTFTIDEKGVKHNPTVLATEVLREMEGYWRYVVWVTPGASTVAQPVELWLTPFGVARHYPGPMPKTDKREDWARWQLKHQWTHAHWAREFAKLWWKDYSKLIFVLTLRTQYCLEGEEHDSK